MVSYLLVQVKLKRIKKRKPTLNSSRKYLVFIPQTLDCCASYQVAAPVWLFRYAAAVSVSSVTAAPRLQGQSEFNLFVLSHSKTSASGESLVTTLARAARFTPVNASRGTPFTCSKLICSNLLMCSAYWHQTDHAECGECLIRLVNKAHSGSTHIVCRNAPIDCVNYTVTFRGGNFFDSC